MECVVVDDASTDGTAEVVGDIAARDPRVVLLRAPANGGASAARNLALGVVRGEWLTFLDADDVLLPGGLDALLRPVSADGVRAVIGQRVWFDGTRRWITGAYDRPDIRTPGRGSLVTRPGLLFYASLSGKLFHRSLVDGLCFEGRVLGDQPWTIRALLRAGDGIEVIGDVVYEWRRDAAAGTSSITKAKHDSALVAAEAARVAVRALAEVRAEAAADLPPEDARVVVAAYFERLVRSDLAGPVRRAAARRDPGTVELFAAIEAFIRAAPAEVVASSEALPTELLEPPLDRWLWVSVPGRRAFVHLVRTVLAVDPGLPQRWPGAGALRMATRLLASAGARSSGEPSAAAEAIATALLTLRLPLVVLRRLRHRERYRRPV